MGINSIHNAAAMFNLVLRLAAAISISFASSLLIKWKTQTLSFIFDNKVNSSNNNLENNITNKDLLYYFYSERESLIIALNKISYISMWTTLVPIILMFYIKSDKKNILY